MFRRSCGLSAGKYPVPTLDLNYRATSTMSGIETFTRSSSAWAYDNAGVLKQYSANLPRFDYGPVALEPRGLLIEEQRTNLVPYSNTFSNWSLTNLTPATASGTAPTGLNEAWLLNATSASGRLAYNISISADTSTYQYSVYLKQGTAAVTDVRLVLSGGSDAIARITWATPGIAVLSGVHAAAPVLNPVRNGWYRATISVANTSRTIILPYVFPAGSTTGATGTVLAFGAQVEVGILPTTYIPTTGSAGTRATDLCSIQTSAFAFNPNEGTLFVEGIGLFDKDTSNDRRIAVFSDGTTSNLLGLSTGGGSTTRQNLYMRSIAGGVAQADVQGIASIPVNTAFKAAGAYKVGDFAACGNGGTVNYSKTGTLPTVSQLGMGSGGSGATGAMYLNRLSYYARRLDNATLARITS